MGNYPHRWHCHQPSRLAFPTVVDCILGAKSQNKAFFLRVVCAKYSRDEKGKPPRWTPRAKSMPASRQLPGWHEPEGNLKKQFQRQDLMKTCAIQGWGEGLVTKAFDEQAWGPELKSPEPTYRQAQ